VTDFLWGVIVGGGIVLVAVLVQLVVIERLR
jgi:hypothetical protein